MESSGDYFEAHVVQKAQLPNWETIRLNLRVWFNTLQSLGQ